MARRTPRAVVAYLSTEGLDTGGFTVKAKGKAYLKEVLREGRYVHPVDGWTLELSSKDIADLADASNEAIANGNRCWIPLGHTSDVEANVGYATRFLVKPSPADPALMSLFAVCDIRDDDIREAIDAGRIEDVSVAIEDTPDGSGVAYGDRIVHVALVNFPVFAGQENFVALGARAGKYKARTQATRDLRYLGVPSMAKILRPKLKKNRMLSGIAAPTIVASVKRRLSVTPVVAKAAKALGLNLKGTRLRQSDLEALCEAAALPARGTKAALSALSRDADATFKELCGERTARVAATVKAAVDAGKLTAPAGELVTKLLSVRHGYALSVDGAAAEVDVNETVTKLLAELPDGASVPLETRIRSLSAAGGRPAGTAPQFDAAKDRADRIAALNPKKA